MIRIRCMTEADLDFAISLTSEEGWSSTRTDFEELLAFDSHGCFIGEENSERIGMVCAIPYGEFGNIGNLIVKDECRGRGVGAMLMEHAMSYLRGKGASEVFLDGVQTAVSLYERLGFKKICKSLRLTGRVRGIHSNLVRPMTKMDLEDVFSIDDHHFKADRSFFIKSCLSHTPSLSKVLEVNRHITGYILGSYRQSSARIGPWVIDKYQQRAENMLRSFSAETGELPLHIGVLESNVRAVKLLRKLGFRVTNYSWRMALGEPCNIDFSKGLYAICSPARG
jgi:ribosomal protein S18 acetylase RimI-like enzyme